MSDVDAGILYALYGVLCSVFGLIAGPAIDSLSLNGWTPLGLAARSGAIDTAKALLDARANVHAVSAQGKTPLEIATTNKKPALVEFGVYGFGCFHLDHVFVSLRDGGAGVWHGV